MASSPLRSKSQFHTRSISLPSGFQTHIPQIDEHLCRLKSSEAISPSSSLADRLSELQDLYNCVEDLILLPRAQQAFSKPNEEKHVEEALERHLRLLDVCSTIKDVFSQTKQDAKDLLSVMRRRKEVDDFSQYLTSRKKAKKVILKSLKDLKSIKSNKSGQNVSIIRMLKELEVATVAVLESLVSNTAGPKVATGFTLISKLVNRKASEGSETVQNQLGIMVISIEDIEEGLDSLIRHLIKTRVSLLNILNL